MTFIIIMPSFRESTIKTQPRTEQVILYHILVDYQSMLFQLYIDINLRRRPHWNDAVEQPLIYSIATIYLP